MNATIIAFFNNKGDVAKTSLVYHLAWMYAELGYRVVAADLDPQANLTSAFLDEDRLEEIWLQNEDYHTIFRCLLPLIRGSGDIADPSLENIDEPSSYSYLALLAGDLYLSSFEEELSEVWPKCMNGDDRAFLITSAFWRIMQKAATIHQADVILMDLGSNLGAINRAALIAADYTIVPIMTDLLSLQSLRSVGSTLRRWREDWQERLATKPALDFPLPPGRMQPIGYLVLHHLLKLYRPVTAYDRWIARIPSSYRNEILDESGNGEISLTIPMADDPHCLAVLKNYISLMPMAQEARKPMFFLKPADGAIGAHGSAARRVYKEFEALARKIADKTELRLVED